MKYLAKMIRYILKRTIDKFSEGERILINKEFDVIDSDKWRKYSYNDKIKVIDNIIKILKIGLSR